MPFFNSFHFDHVGAALYITYRPESMPLFCLGVVELGTNFSSVLPMRRLFPETQYRRTEIDKSDLENHFLGRDNRNWVTITPPFDFFDESAPQKPTSGPSLCVHLGKVLLFLNQLSMSKFPQRPG
jgi:hypothetical protein